MGCDGRIGSDQHGFLYRERQVLLELPAFNVVPGEVIKKDIGKTWKIKMLNLKSESAEGSKT